MRQHVCLWVANTGAHTTTLEFAGGAREEEWKSLALCKYVLTSISLGCPLSLCLAGRKPIFSFS